MILWTTLFINQAAFIWMAMSKGKTFWFIFLISFLYSNITNVIFYYGTEWCERALKMIRGEKKKSKWHRMCYTILRRWGRKAKIIPMVIYFFMPIVPVIGIKEICIVIADLEGIKFRVLVILSAIQIIIIYYGRLLLS